MKKEDKNNISYLIMQVHIAEYTTLTTRSTYLITCQFSLLPVIIIYLALAAQIWNSGINHALLIWVSCLFVQIIGLLWYYCGIECYKNIYYIEKELRPLIENEIGALPFWKYEKYLSKIRPERCPLWFEWTIPIITIIIIVTICLTHYKGWSKIDSYGLLINIILTVLLCVATYFYWQMRQNFFK